VDNPLFYPKIKFLFFICFLKCFVLYYIVHIYVYSELLLGMS